MLSLIFRGRVLADPRLPRLRRLAWLWSAENMLLAAAVYHRLFIYIGFNTHASGFDDPKLVKLV